MGEKHNICRKVIDDKVNQEIPFTYEEVCKEIKEKGGLLRVSSGTTVGKYLQNLEENKIIEFKLQGIKYFNKETMKYFQENVLMFVPYSHKN